MSDTNTPEFSPAEIKRAMMYREFTLLYQPVVDLRSRAPVGAEALLRWRHPKHGVLSPDRFIRVAESSGVIVALGEWVLREACLQNRTWQERGLPALTIAVNVSAAQLDADFRSRVNAALADASLAPRHLELELTESVMFADPAAFHLFEALRRAGIGFAADDFGTGYSCLALLKCCPVTKLKIDKSFVAGIADDTINRAIAQTVISLGHALNLRIVAEGVEQERDLIALETLGCDQVQGNYFAKPMAADAFAVWLKESGAFVL